MKKIVIGLGFGDEGKGLVVDWLARKGEKHVVRYSGGHQVGHCVRTEKERHIFSNFGSGTIAWLKTIWNAKTVDPVGFCKEYEDIKHHDPMISINPKCPITTPFDKIANVMSNNISNHGTMGVGFGATIEREEANYHLRYMDIYYPSILEAKLDSVESYCLSKGVYCDYNLRLEFLESCEKMKSIANMEELYPDDGIFESSQGLMLDMDYGIFPNVTRSRVGTQELNLNEDDELFLVTRAYQTRHGNGWCSNKEIELVNTDETNQENEYQGEFKKRVLDLDLIRYALSVDDGIRKSMNKSLVITCLDHLGSYQIDHKGKRYTFEKEFDFIDFIVGNLTRFKKYYVSHGPTHKDIKEL